MLQAENTDISIYIKKKDTSFGILFFNLKFKMCVYRCKGLMTELNIHYDSNEKRFL